MARNKEKGDRKSRLWGGRLSESPEESVLSFLSGRDVSQVPPLDSFLLESDLKGSQAHAKGLAKRGIISKEELGAILGGLGKIRKEGITLSPETEDVHTAVEKSLEELKGNPARVLHTGRSRNDQVSLDTRIFLKGNALLYERLLRKMILSLLDKAESERESIMPGYTHQRRAMLTTFGHYLFSVATALDRDRRRLSQWLELYDFSPLGSAASYGTCFPIDREFTAKELGFGGPEPSSLDPIQNRWEAEASFVFAISIAMNHLSSFAQTLIVFSSPEFGYLELPDGFCTGSSIMPQKKNPDFLELVKGKASLVSGQLSALLSIGNSSFIGYNRDTQVTKQILVDCVLEARGAFELFPGFIGKISCNRERMRSESEKGFITATHFLESFVVKTKTPFREAKFLVEKAVKFSEGEGAEKITPFAFEKAGGKGLSEKEIAKFQSPEKILASYKSLGSPNPKDLQRQIAALRKGLK